MDQRMGTTHPGARTAIRRKVLAQRDFSFRMPAPAGRCAVLVLRDQLSLGVLLVLLVYLHRCSRR